MARASALPNQIPPQTVPIVAPGPNGELTVDVNWYLFLYNLWKNVLQGQTNGAVVVPPAVFIPIEDVDVSSADIYQAYRGIANSLELQPDSPDVYPTLRDMANSLLLGQSDLLQDPTPLAQPSASISLTGSPMTWSAPATGALAISGTVVTAVSVKRQGTTIATGQTVGMVPVSKFDQVVISYTGTPVLVFLPT